MSCHTRPITIGAKSLYQVCTKVKCEEPCYNRDLVKCSYCCSVINASGNVDLTAFSEDCETIVKLILTSQKSVFINKILMFQIMKLLKSILVKMKFDFQYY